ncbi:uncharacterized protein V6R79_005591 [Siganus canaliculatus]
MSSRMSSSSGEGLPSSRCGERTPLRSLENERLHLSTPSLRTKSKTLLTPEVGKITKVDAPLCGLDPSPSSRGIQTNVEVTTTEAACELGDITFKSFICAGGEIAITDLSQCAEPSIQGQATLNTCETEDTFISDSVIVESCSDHTDHPYYNPEVKDVSLSDTDAGFQSESTALASSNLDDTGAAEGFRALQHELCEEKDVTWKSFVCDGGEVEIDVTRLQDDTISLPKAQDAENLQDTSVSSANLSISAAVLCEAEHAEHPYCSSKREDQVITTFFDPANCHEEATRGLNDITFKSFNCTGGEIQISDGTRFLDETVPLTTAQTALNVSADNGLDPSILADCQDVKDSHDHLDHPYCNAENDQSTPSCNLEVSQEILPLSLDAVDEVTHNSLAVPDHQTDGQEAVIIHSFVATESEAEDSRSLQLSQKMSFLPGAQDVVDQPLDDRSKSVCVTQTHIQESDEHPDGPLERDAVVVDCDPPPVSTSSLTKEASEEFEDDVNSQVKEASNIDSVHPEDDALPSVLQVPDSSDHSHPVEPVEAKLDHVSEVHLSGGSQQSSESKDSAICSSENVPVLCNSAEKPHLENLPDVLKVLSECPSVASAWQFGLLSPVIRRASQFASEANKDRTVDQFLSEDSALEGEKSLLAPVSINPAGIWAEHLESPMPRPLLNSTTLICKAQSGPVTESAEDVAAKPCPAPQPEMGKPVMGIPMIPEGPLQQQLRQMAEFLILASGKMGPSATPAPVPPQAAVAVPSARTSPAESHSVCVGTTPVKCVDHSINTSGQFERKKVLSVADSCTLTDPLLWNVPPGSLEGLPRQELEQRLRSSMIMVEALVQQLSTARALGCPAGPAPSDLREKLVQTDHTEMSQTSMHRELYLEALNRIDVLELDGRTLQHLIQCMQEMRAQMTSLSCDTDDALSNLTQIKDVVRDDHQSLVSHYRQMKSVLEKAKQTQTEMMKKVKDAFHLRDEMRTQMEEAFAAKEAAFCAMDELRAHCALEISELEKVVGAQRELSAALEQTCPELVALNHACNETLNSASHVLSATIEEQSNLMKELCTVRGFLKKTAPMLLKLNEKAAAALKERDEHISARDQAFEERDQMEEELNQANVNLQTAREEIGDLNLQVTILTSEMGVLRQKLTGREEEQGQLERKVTELSATVSSTLASYTFLEQALAAETTKLQQSWKDIQSAKDRANELEASLGQSEQRVSELSQALAESEEQLGQLQVLSQSQSAEIQQLKDVCTQLGSVREMNEFLQMENELAREQMTESESTLRANLQGLRERNIQCEDLKGELSRLQLDNQSLHEQLETTRSTAAATQLELEEKLAQTSTEIALLHHTLRGLANELQAALIDQTGEESQTSYHERRHPSSSFVDSIMVALTAEKEEDEVETESEALFSETSAFTRIAGVTPKKTLSTVEVEPEDDEQSSVAKLFAGLDATVNELISTLKLLQQRKDAQLAELQNTVCGLQVEQEATNNRYEEEVCDLKQQLVHLNSVVEKGSQALQQKAQDDKTVSKLMSEIQETKDFLNKHKTESSELRREVVELRRGLQQSKVECQFLRGELRKAGGQSAPPAAFMDERIQLLREVERLKLSLQEVEEARAKLLDRAKRHQIIHQNNQQKSENELQLLNRIINKVREVSAASRLSSFRPCVVL